MTPAQAVEAIVSELRSLRSDHSGDDSAVQNVWEELKDQLQGEPSPFVQVYLATAREYVRAFVATLHESDYAALQVALKAPSREAITAKLFRRLQTRARKESVAYAPFDFEFFSYPLLDFRVYGQVVRRIGIHECHSRVFSPAAPSGEYGNVKSWLIEEVLSREEFDRARLLEGQRLCRWCVTGSSRATWTALQRISRPRHLPELPQAPSRSLCRLPTRRAKRNARLTNGGATNSRSRLQAASASRSESCCWPFTPSPSRRRCLTTRG
jgi:hypothetical protein